MTRPATSIVRAAISLAGAAVLATVVTACSSDAAEPAAPDRQVVLTALVDDVFVPSYERVVSTGQALTAAIDAACAGGTGGDVTAARAAWSDLRQAWLRTRSFRFGPAIDQRAMSDVDFPVDTSKIDALLGSDRPLDEPDVASLGADQRGMNAIEHVLFADAPPDERGCAYLRALGSLLVQRAERVLAEWTVGGDGAPSFADQIRHPGEGDGNMYADQAEVYGDLVNHMIFAIGDVSDSRIGRASGDVTGTPLPEEVDAGRAHRALADAEDILAGVIAVYGDAGRSDTIRAVVAGLSEQTAAALDEQFAAAVAALDAIPAPLHDSTDPAPAQAAYQAVKAAQVTLRAEVASLLGVTLTFGDADGDS